MVTFICIVVCVALAAAFVVLFMDRAGLRERVVATAPKPISEMFGCDFCLSWWSCAALAVITAVICRDAAILAAPLFATPITRALL